MSERTSTHDAPGDDRPFPGVAPSVRRIVTDAIPPRDRSLPVALCAVGGEVGSRLSDGSSPSRGRAVDRTLEPITNAVALFQGYVRIRDGLLTSDRYDRSGDRDAALLASDYLHAAAYARVADASVSDRRAIELYRVLTEGSTGLATRFLSRAEADAGSAGLDADGDDRRLDAVLAGTAAALGATAVGATDEARTAIDRYGRALLAAVDAAPSSDDCRERATLVLSDRDATGERGEPTRSRSAPDGDGRRAVERHLDRARAALATLEEVGHPAIDGRGATPFARLERATRIPFRDVLETDD